MTLRKVDLLYIGGALLVILGVSFLPSPKDRNPVVPGTVEHRGVRMEHECLTCHGPGGARALAVPPHPTRHDCLHCHRTTI